ncbi:hypothetical protein EDB19DRAFT_1670765 [Suillus lakei]|nr:hypothetical protein EDB19DRAFT_1670765 [Suillus lakei]
MITDQTSVTRTLALFSNGEFLAQRLSSDSHLTQEFIMPMIACAIPRSLLSYCLLRGRRPGTVTARRAVLTQKLSVKKAFCVSVFSMGARQVNVFVESNDGFAEVLQAYHCPVVYPAFVL